MSNDSYAEIVGHLEREGYSESNVVKFGRGIGHPKTPRSFFEEMRRVYPYFTKPTFDGWYITMDDGAEYELCFYRLNLYSRYFLIRRSIDEAARFFVKEHIQVLLETRGIPFSSIRGYTVLIRNSVVDLKILFDDNSMYVSRFGYLDKKEDINGYDR